MIDTPRWDTFKKLFCCYAFPSILLPRAYQKHSSRTMLQWVKSSSPATPDEKIRRSLVLVPGFELRSMLPLAPLIDLRFRLGEGTGPVVCMELLDLSTRILADIKTFEEVGVTNI